MSSVLLKYVYYGITVVSLIVLGLSVKYLLGGYDEIIIEETDAINYVIAGKYVDQQWTDEEVETWDLELSSKLEEGKVKGRIASIAFFPDSMKTASAVRFSGIAMQGNIVTIPSGYKVVDIYEPKGLKTLLKMNPLVRPTLEELRSIMTKSAIENGQELDDRLLLFHGQQDSLTVMAGVR